MAPDVPSVLQEIVAHKREEVAAAKAARPRIDLTGLAPARDFAGAIRRPARDNEGGDSSEPRLAPDACRLIAEVKRASPTKGLLRSDFEPVSLARAYAENGPAAIPVLTDER